MLNDNYKAFRHGLSRCHLYVCLLLVVDDGAPAKVLLFVHHLHQPARLEEGDTVLGLGDVGLIEGGREGGRREREGGRERRGGGERGREGGQRGREGGREGRRTKRAN